MYVCMRHSFAPEPFGLFFAFEINQSQNFETWHNLS